MPEIRIHPATEPDATTLATIFTTSFTTDIDLAMFPPTPAVHNWWTRVFAADIARTPSTRVFKAVDDATGKVAGYAVWALPGCAHAGDDEMPPFPAECDAGLCERFFGAMDEMMDVVMCGVEGFYYLKMLATRPEYRGQGIASRLLRWGMERAEEEKVPVFLSSSPAGKSVYERAGFEEKAMRVLDGGYQQRYFVWRPDGC
ncbi:acyl-CoA N-acyltransferase [Aspergillus campestris IBT 28561]|uniref:Acyl-CoA N-acyltransferase n=1 Tax=Aspergillus campestris (strain IBT 28561) TaxID=1392248 RepID=A0A2I1DB63_ASPC2|nr:acyl-CoA N-acyltransferase [Aspergillus campestris IBT 28561]PKY07114.1 acyl-CoA N-acyltransferase [Aspergillus campestris IBT 28561]